MHFISLLAGALVSGAAFAADPVRTTSGHLTGKQAKNAASVTAYLGIPFAEPPVGARRFAAPVRYHSTAPRNATSFGRDCPGSTGGLSFGGSSSSSNTSVEDCLFLNMWVPEKKPKDGPKAVMLWLYGGAFVMGGTRNSYDGSRLAASQDVIVITTNYRLHIWGYPGARGLKEQNAGLLDQRMAVEWARDNVAAFGGDPKRITIFGESAGADSVDLYSYAWAKDPIVAGLISESGASTMCGLVGNQSYSGWKVVSEALQCRDDKDGAKELACMQSKTVSEIRSAASRTRNSTFPPNFVPTIDEKIVFNDYFDRGSKGLFAKVPYIIGNNDRELGENNIGSDSEFTCPSAQVANSRRAAGVPVWRYRYYGGGPPGDGVSTQSVSAAHAAEISYVFGNPRGEQTAQKTAVSKEMTTVWAAFARDPAKGPIAHGWPLYDPKADTLVRLFYRNESTHSLERGDKFDANCTPQICKLRASAPKGGKSSKGLGSKGLGGKQSLSGLLALLGKAAAKAKQSRDAKSSAEAASAAATMASASSAAPVTTAPTVPKALASPTVSNAMPSSAAKGMSSSVAKAMPSSAPKASPSGAPKMMM